MSDYVACMVWFILLWEGPVQERDSGGKKCPTKNTEDLRACTLFPILPFEFSRIVSIWNKLFFVICFYIIWKTKMLWILLIFKDCLHDPNIYSYLTILLNAKKVHRKVFYLIYRRLSSFKAKVNYPKSRPELLLTYFYNITRFMNRVKPFAIWQHNLLAKK